MGDGGEEKNKQHCNVLFCVAFLFLEIYLEIGFDNSSFCITALMHPTTYLNKILLASRRGSMQLWNIKTK